MAEDRKGIWRSIGEVLPFLAFFALLFFADQTLFGVADALLGIVFLFFSRTIAKQPGLSRVNYARRCAWFFLMALCATLAGLHPVAMVVVTGIYLFVMTVFNSDDYLPRNFFWLGLGYLLLLVYPVGVDGIGMRLVATIFSLACTSAFVWIMRRYWKLTGELDVFAIDRSFVRRAFDEAAEQLEALADGDIGRIDRKLVFAISQEYATAEYPTVYRQDGLLSGRQGYTFAQLLCVEQIAYNAQAASAHYDKFDEDEKNYYRDLALILRGFGEGRLTTVHAFADALDEFLATHVLGIEEYQESWRAVLECMVRTVRDTRMSRDMTTPFLKSTAYRMYYLRDNINLRNTQTRFALQLAAIVSLAMIVDILLTDYIGQIYGIWIPITAFTILNTYNDETVKSTRNNFLGTVAGILVFAFVIHFIPADFRMPLVIVFSYGVILLNWSPATNVAAGTQIALTALYPYMDSLEETIFSRLFLVLVAVTCVMLVIFLFMRTRRAKTIGAKVAELERIDLRLAKAVDRGLKYGSVNLWVTERLLFYLHMDAELLSRLSNSVRNIAAASAAKRPPRTKRRKARRKAQVEANRKLAADVEKCLTLNYRFTVDAAHLAMLLDPRRANFERWRTGDVYADSPMRLEHLDNTKTKLDGILQDLAGLRYLERADEEDRAKDA